jgi:hypothetical protein
MGPSIQAIPTFGIYPSDTPPSGAEPRQIPKILMIRPDGVIQVVGIFGRTHG